MDKNEEIEIDASLLPKDEKIEIDASLLTETKIKEPKIKEPEKEVVCVTTSIGDRPVIYYDIIVHKSITEHMAKSIKFCVDLIKIGIERRQINQDGQIVRIVDMEGVILHKQHKSNGAALAGAMLVLGII